MDLTIGEQEFINKLERLTNDYQPTAVFMTNLSLNIAYSVLAGSASKAEYEFYRNQIHMILDSMERQIEEKGWEDATEPG